MANKLHSPQSTFDQIRCELTEVSQPKNELILVIPIINQLLKAWSVDRLVESHPHYGQQRHTIVQ